MSYSDNWTKHTPGPCPVDPDTIVRVRLEDGCILSPMAAEHIDWDCPGDQVIEYEVVEE